MFLEVECNGKQEQGCLPSKNATLVRHMMQVVSSYLSVILQQVLC